MSQEKKMSPVLSKNLFPVVGVGASAGGLEAFKELVKAIPEDSGMAYILVQHLAPQHESLLADILQKATRLPVVEISDNLKVFPNHIYIIPSNKILTASDGILQLDALVPGVRLNTIDVFLSSLAEIHQQYAIGVVLSGTGGDGTTGLKMIKDQGGVTIVQDRASAAYFAMPQSAIEAGVVDFVLPPGEIPGRLKEIAGTLKVAFADGNITGELHEEELFKQVLALVKARHGVDFTYYKQSTIRRRILRRRLLNRMETLKDYKEYLFENKGEQDTLFTDILIPVTAFFRDAKSFAVLCNTVLPDLYKNKTASNPIRIWVAGCSTGEEAYSIAMCLHEYVTGKDPAGAIQIFATDLSEASIAKARSGIYNKRDMAGISDARLKQFFTKTDSGYQVNKVIREICVFACHNFVKDPPFAKIDLISCRNVLIYMEPYLQKKALTTFHYALKTTGILFLGRSESIGSLSQQFNTFSQQDRLYKRNVTAGKYMPVATEKSETALKQENDSLKREEPRKDDFQKAADDALLSKYATVGVVVNEKLDIIQFRGATGPYLEAPPGKASHALLRMAREGLSFELRNALHKAKESGATVRKEAIHLEEGKRKVDIEVIPLQKTIEIYFLVLFADTPKPPVAETKGRKKQRLEETAPSQEAARVVQLEKELAQVREDMRAVTESQEAANEELQSANEELLSGSEELQTLNEELESSKEEIQSTNEELTILNQELLNRNGQLVHARTYAEAVVSTIHEPLLILTKDFKIKSANRCFYEMCDAMEEHTEGKPFFELENGMWNVAGLQESLRKILPEQSYFQGLEINIVCPRRGPRIMELNARQIINESSNEQLILLAIHDITERSLLDKAQKQFAQELEQQVLEQTRELKEANLSLQQSNENLQQFASIASHDLQEPLRKVKTFTAVLEKSFAAALPDEGKEVISKIKVSADRMSQLIKEVLAYSKVVHGQKDFILTDLHVILKSVLNDLDLLISEKGAVIAYNDPLPVIVAIPLQMNQLFYNLLTNALKFYKEATPPVITITSRMLADEEIKKHSILQADLPHIEITFSDNGIGFEQQFADQIFQLFERLHPVDEYEGAGVGLALCKKIVENHRGLITAYAKEGEGASFLIILPTGQQMYTS